MALTYQFPVILLVMAYLFQAKSDECIELPTLNQTAYYNWPIFWNCHDFAAECGVDAETYSCKITAIDANETLLSSEYEYDYYGDSVTPSYEISNVTTNTSNTIGVFVMGSESGDCCTTILQLQKRRVPAYNCWNYNRLCSAGSSKTSLMEPRSFECKLPFGSGEPEPKNLANYQITWYYNCNTSLPNGVTVDDASNNLVITSFDPLLHPGNYSCSIYNNGETRQIAEYCVCAQPQRVIAELSILCITDEIRYKVGDTATILCNVNIGGGDINPILYVATFKPVLENGLQDNKKENFSCTVELQSDVGGHSDRVNCSFKVVGRFQEDCLYDIPTLEQWEVINNKSEKALELTYTLSQLEESDFGFYEAYIGTSSGKNNDTAVIRLFLDLGEKDRAIRIGIAVGATALVLVITMCAIYLFRLHIRLAWKRSNCMAYDKDLMEYGAYMTYYWSNEENENEKNLEASRKLIEGMRKCINSLGFKIYDPTESPSEHQWEIQNILSGQRQCDRVVIILTSDFMKKLTAEQDLFSNFLEKKFILIITPDFEAAFKKLNEDIKNGLNAHFQRNYTIKWSGRYGELSKRMQMELELAMPKRKRAKDTRLL